MQLHAASSTLSTRMTRWIHPHLARAIDASGAGWDG